MKSLHTSLNTAHSGCKPSTFMSLTAHYPHILSKSSFSSPYISPLPPPPFYRPIPNHPHSYAPNAHFPNHLNLPCLLLLLLLLLLLHLITHPTKCYTNSRVCAPSEKTNSEQVRLRLTTSSPLLTSASSSHHIRHTLYTQKTTNLHCVSYPSATPRTSISPSSIPSSPDYADLFLHRPGFSPICQHTLDTECVGIWEDRVVTCKVMQPHCIKIVFISFTTSKSFSGLDVILR